MRLALGRHGPKLAVMLISWALVLALAGCTGNETKQQFQSVQERTSPAFGTILYAAFGGDGQLYVNRINTDGSGNVLLTPPDNDPLTPDGGFHPFWRPTATVPRMLVYVAKEFGSNDLFLLDASGGNRTRLTDDPASDMQPCFSADGKKIVFVSNRDGTNDIWLLQRTDGAEIVAGTTTADVRLTQLTFGPADDQWPCFSPDGTLIVFQSDADDGDGVSDTDLYVVPAAGGALTNLTPGAANDSNQGGPSWGGASGDKILFHDDRAGDWDIWVMDDDGTNLQQLVGGTLMQGHPTWFPDGSRFSFTEARAIWTADPDGGNREQVTFAF